MGYHLWFHRGSCEWNSVHCQDFQGKKVPGTMFLGIFQEEFSLNRSNHSTTVQII